MKLRELILEQMDKQDEFVIGFYLQSRNGEISEDQWIKKIHQLGLDGKVISSDVGADQDGYDVDVLVRGPLSPKAEKYLSDMTPEEFRNNESHMEWPGPEYGGYVEGDDYFRNVTSKETPSEEYTKELKKEYESLNLGRAVILSGPMMEVTFKDENKLKKFVAEKSNRQFDVTYIINSTKVSAVIYVNYIGGDLL